MIRVGVVGLGLMGQKRVASILQSQADCELAAVCDLQLDKAQALSQKCGVRSYESWEAMLAQERLDALVVSTHNAAAAAVCLGGLEKGVHVFCEKPLGRNSKEAAMIYRLARKKHLILKVGFTLRFHPAIAVAWQSVQGKELGRPLFCRCVYGHGGRSGYEKEWRACRELAGGGELLDQGVHVIDLFRWFLGDIAEVYGYIDTLYWKMEVEDNAFALFRTFSGPPASMHTSWSQWKNKFIFELYGEKGYITVEGLGGSYGPEKLVTGLKKGEFPEEKVFFYSQSEQAFQKEWGEFVAAIKERRQPLASGWDGFMANLVVEAIYRSAQEKKPVVLPAEKQLWQTVNNEIYEEM